MKKTDPKLPEFTTADISKFMEASKTMKDLNIRECEFNPGLRDLKLSGKYRGGREDQFYIENDYYRANVRRGGSVFEQNKKVIIARKGLQKFFYIKYGHINDNAKETEVGKKSKKQAKKTDSKIKNIIFGDIFDAFHDKHKVKIYQLVKANGENCQIAYLHMTDSWVIASKNVSLLAKERNDLEKYRSAERYSFAYLIGVTWFDILNKRKICLKTLKEDLKDKTMVGEYCGNQNHLHLIKYEKEDIFFYAIVDHHTNDTCISPIEAYSLFKKHNLTVVPLKEHDESDNFNDLKLALRNLYESIAVSNIEDEGEGSVLYFEEKQGNKNRVLSLCKLKTLEYSIFRKLREKLKTSIKYKEKKDILLGVFKKETKLMCENLKPPKRLGYYFKIAENCFLEVEKKKIENLQDNYLHLLSEVRNIVDQNEINYSEEEKEKEEEKKYFSKNILQKKEKNSEKSSRDQSLGISEFFNLEDNGEKLKKLNKNIEKVEKEMEMKKEDDIGKNIQKKTQNKKEEMQVFENK